VGQGGKKYHTNEKLLQLVDHQYTHSKIGFPRNFFKEKMLEVKPKKQHFLFVGDVKMPSRRRDGISVTPTQQTRPSLKK